MSHLTQGAIALNLQSVSFRTSDNRILVNDIDFHVHAGEILTIVGPNGSGKTTIIKMITGLLSPSSGCIFLDDLSYESFDFAERAKRIAYVGQTDNPDGRLTVQQYVGLGRLPHIGVLTCVKEVSLIRNALEITGIEQLSKQHLARLSGGEMQRVHIARAICQQPGLLVLDEPTNHLDPAARGELLGLVSSLGITIVAVLHDLTLIEAFATHVAVIKNGCLVGYGHPEEVLSQQMVRDVFDVNMHRLPHPDEKRHITALDIHISKSNTTIPVERINS